MKKVRVRELRIGDTFKTEYGCYGNWVDATITNIEPTEYDHIKVFTYICNGNEYKNRMVVTDFVRV